MSLTKGIILSGTEARILFTDDLIETFYDEMRDEFDMYSFEEIVDRLRDHIVEVFEEILEAEGVDCAVIIQERDTYVAYDGEEFLEAMRKIYGDKSVEEMLRSFVRDMGIKEARERVRKVRIRRKGMRR